jgi:hypothetical protein
MEGFPYFPQHVLLQKCKLILLHKSVEISDKNIELTMVCILISAPK